VAYVGGFDRKIHAIDAATGQRLWTFEAEKGFQTNPLVVGNKLYAGNRDGYFYAIYVSGPQTGQLAWKYKTDGPILYSAAYKDGVVFFASQDMHAYALDAQTGSLVWKSQKLPGAGFHSWWPVIYDDPNTGRGFVIFSGSLNYRKIDPSIGDHPHLDREDIYENPDGTYPPNGTPVGPVTTEPDGSITIDAGKITEYFEEPTDEEKREDPAGLNRKNHKPWRRTVFYLDRSTGEEYTFDSDGDGQPEYAPILYQGTRSGTRYPPIVGGNGVIYQANNYLSERWIPRGYITGWRVGTADLIKVPKNPWGSFPSFAVDEPIVYSGGGNLIYYNHCMDDRAGSFNVTPGSSPTEYWGYNLAELIPGYWDLLYWDPPPKKDPGVYNYGLNTNATVSNGIYGRHGDQNPLVPYRGRVYVILSNVLMALSPSAEWSNAIQLPMAEEVPAQDNPPNLSEADLKQLLEKEVSQILAAGHLRAALVDGGLGEGFMNWEGHIDRLTDYWKTPGDTIYYLIRALLHVSPSLQQQLKDYLEAEFNNYPPYQYVHIGWKDGAQREVFDLPPEIEVERVNFGPRTNRFGTNFTGWDFPPHQFYAMWKYAELMNDPNLSAQIFNAGRHRLETPPPDSYLIERPYVLNAYIAGYLGYINLGKLAGLSDQDLQPQQTELDRLLALRVSTFSKDSPTDETLGGYAGELRIARNFLYMVPELAAHLRANLLTEIKEAVEEYDNVAPYWFVSNHEATYGEGIVSYLFNYHALFQAKAQILQEPREELVKYLDIPGVKLGDLFILITW